MMNRLQIISLLFFILLAAGCRQSEVPATVGDDMAPIDFSAGAMQLTTKAASFKTDYELNNEFDVFARRTLSNFGSDIMEGTRVRLSAINGVDSTWRYTPLRYWTWSSSFDYYDFIGVWPVGEGTRVSGGGDLAVKAPYSVTPGYEDDYDLMMAARRRNRNEANPNAIVPMRFDHMLCAVRVVVTNDSEIAPLTFNFIEFQHLILEGTVYASLDAMGRPDYRWSDIVRKSYGDGLTIRQDIQNTVLYSKGIERIDPTKTRTYTGDFEFFIPCDLTQTSNGLTESDPGYRNYLPTLHIRHSTVQDEYIKLMDVARRDRTPITEWKRGVKYTYNISIRLDGGVIVHVITTEWDRVDAETPGIMIEFPS